MTFISVRFGWLLNRIVHPTCYYYGRQTGYEYNFGNDLTEILQMVANGM